MNGMASPIFDANSSEGLMGMPANRGQRARAFVIWMFLVGAFLVAAPFANVQFPRSNAFVVAVHVLLVTTNFVTAYLLYGQFAIYGNYAVLVLASGYLFAGLVIIPYSLAFPGVVAESGLIGTIQTTPWLNVFWHIGFAFAVAAYALLKDEPRTRFGKPEASKRALIRGVALTTGLAGLVWWVCVEDVLPMLFLTDMRGSSRIHIFASGMSLSAIFALVLLWRRRRTALDLWLLIALWAEASEPILAAVLNSSRFTVGFYSSRVYSIITSTIVLMSMLSLIVKLQRKLAESVQLLERERQSKMVNMDAVTASIAHEVRQPLAAIAANGSAALLLIDQPAPDLPEIRGALDAIVKDSIDADHVLAAVRTLFALPTTELQQLDINDIARSAVRMSRAALSENGIEFYTDLSPDVPPIAGQKTQLREVLSNLVQNAIEAMSLEAEHPRVLWLKTAALDGKQVCITLDDSGPGISAEKLESVFDVFFTTKANGTGLGLAICRTIVERHGGTIAASASECGGARITVVLPSRSEFL